MCSSSPATACWRCSRPRGSVLTVRTSPKTFTVRYYLGRIGGYRAGAGRTLVRLAERLRIADKLWTPDFRDRMLVIADARP